MIRAMHPFLLSYLGGQLVGLGVWLLFAGMGRVADISAMLCSTLNFPRKNYWRIAFFVGLVLGGWSVSQVLDGTYTSISSTPWRIAAGLLVGFGAALAGGCATGHGVCGVARGSRRAYTAVVVFTVTGIITATCIHLLGHQ